MGKRLIDESTLTDICDAIREKEGTTELIPVTGISSKIAGLSSGGGGSNKLAQLVDRSVTEIIAEDLEGATMFGDYAFSGCRGLTNITIPDSVTRIGFFAFRNCSGFTSIIIPDSVTSIGDNAFNGCSGLTSITMSNSVTSIGSSTFYYCSGLTSITIPNSVTSIGSSALQIGSTTNKATIIFLSTTPPTITTSTFKASYLNKIIVPAGCDEAYKSATNWSNFADYIEEAME